MTQLLPPPSLDAPTPHIPPPDLPPKHPVPGRVIGGYVVLAIQYLLVLPLVLMVWLCAMFTIGIVMGLLSRKVAAVTLGVLVVGSAFGATRRRSWLLPILQPWARPWRAARDSVLEWRR